MDPHCIRRLRNPVRNYAWGSRTAIAELLGEPSPAPEPQAELWMGAHPSAPSRVVTEEGEVPLDAWIARDPDAVLGPGVAARFGGKLPFLFKVLAVDRPLSVQTHPGLAQARAGFAREDAAGVPLDAPQRCFRDDNHKPELICALTPFDVLCGFREIAEILAYFDALQASALVEELTALREGAGSEDLARLFQAWMSLDSEARASVLGRAGVLAAARGDADSTWQRVGRLAELYPDDVGVLAPLFLNAQTLEPGMALYLAPGEPHCYLGGVGLEIMANSDNVLRGGLTGKHVDVPELLAALTFEAGPLELLRPQRVERNEARYATPTQEFELSTVRLTPGMRYEGRGSGGPEIWLCTEGRAHFVEGDRRMTEVSRGASVLVPGAGGDWYAQGEATVHRAAVATERAGRPSISG
jgi:mannose-6-phosphate isomerase